MQPTLKRLSRDSARWFHVFTCTRDRAQTCNWRRTTPTHYCSTHLLLPWTYSLFEGDSERFGSRNSEGNIVFTQGPGRLRFIWVLYKIILSWDCLHHHIDLCTIKMIYIITQTKQNYTKCLFFISNRELHPTGCGTSWTGESVELFN